MPSSERRTSARFSARMLRGCSIAIPIRINMTPKERMLAVLHGERPDQVPTGELGVDYPITEYVLGRSTYYRAKRKERSAVWNGGRDEVVASQKRDLVALARAMEWDFV